MSLNVSTQRTWLLSAHSMRCQATVAVALRCPSGYGFPYPGSKISTSSSKMETVHVLVIYVVNSDVLNSGIHLSTDAKDIVYRKTPILTAFFGQKLAKVRKTVPYHDDIVKS